MEGRGRGSLPFPWPARCTVARIRCHSVTSITIALSSSDSGGGPVEVGLTCERSVFRGMSRWIFRRASRVPRGCHHFLVLWRAQKRDHWLSRPAARNDSGGLAAGHRRRGWRSRLGTRTSSRPSGVRLSQHAPGSAARLIPRSASCSPHWQRGHYCCARRVNSTTSASPHELQLMRARTACAAACSRLR
jgi:hypothetical protein